MEFKIFRVCKFNIAQNIKGLFCVNKAQVGNAQNK